MGDDKLENKATEFLINWWREWGPILLKHWHHVDVDVFLKLSAILWILYYFNTFKMKNYKLKKTTKWYAQVAS